MLAQMTNAAVINSGTLALMTKYLSSTIMLMTNPHDISAEILTLNLITSPQRC